MKQFVLLLTAASLLLAPSVTIAQSKDEKKMLRMVAECTYVVNIAEQNGVRLRNSAGSWREIQSNVSQQLNVDVTKYVTEAKAKYDKRARVMGADEALRKIAQRAQDCDAQL